MKTKSLILILICFGLWHCGENKKTSQALPVRINIAINSWKIKAGDDHRWVKPDFDDTSWDSIQVKQKWQDAGFKYTGYVWYRKHLVFDSKAKTECDKYGFLKLRLGSFDDVGEVFVNGDSVGQLGQFDPFQSAWGKQSAFRVPLSIIKWDQDNLIAVRMFSPDTIGGGMFEGEYNYEGVQIDELLHCRVTVYRTEPVLAFKMQIRYDNNFVKSFNGTLHISMVNEDSTFQYKTSKEIEIKKGYFESNPFNFQWTLPRFGVYYLSCIFDDGISKYTYTKKINFDQNPYPQSSLLAGIRWLSEPLRYSGSHGDTWITTWADDDNLYSTADDNLGVNPKIKQGLVEHVNDKESNFWKDFSCNSNLSFNRIEGSAEQCKLFNVNCMEQYGHMGQVDGSDTWKAAGLISIDGVLYMAVSQHSGAGDYPDNVQRAYDASIIKSYDHGKTWSAKPKIGKAMFSSPRFATPFFVQFGKDYKNAMDDYVYAASNIGTWNNGNAMLMARVKKNKIADLNFKDWEFFNGFDKDSLPLWSPNYKVIQASIFQYIGHSSMSAIQWVPSLKRFILLQWCYTDLQSKEPWKETTLQLYESKKPWGPYYHFYTEMNWGNALYNAVLPSKWFEDGGMKAWMVSSGDFANTYNELSYCFTEQKLEFILK